MSEAADGSKVKGLDGFSPLPIAELAVERMLEAISEVPELRSFLTERRSDLLREFSAWCNVGGFDCGAVELLSRMRVKRKERVLEHKDYEHFDTCYYWLGSDVACRDGWMVFVISSLLRIPDLRVVHLLRSPATPASFEWDYLLQFRVLGMRPRNPIVVRIFELRVGSGLKWLRWRITDYWKGRGDLALRADNSRALAAALMGITQAPE